MINEKPIKSANLQMLQFIAEKLGELCNEIVFIGGCAASLLISDIVSPDVRQTMDVDCIIDVISLVKYNQLGKQLRKKGFKQSSQDNVLCRWRIDEFILDIMPIDKNILGFTNRWYKTAIQCANSIILNNEITINIISSPYFLATKLEAFYDRGRSDYFASHDLEDIISVIDGRTEVVDEVLNSDKTVREFIATSFSKMLINRKFQDALPGHLNYGAILDERVKIVSERMQQIIINRQ